MKNYPHKRYKGTKMWEHRANAFRDAEIDIPDKFKVMNTLRKNFKLYALTDEVVLIPESGYCNYRKPDLFVKSVYPQLAIDLHGGGPHGYGDEATKPDKDYYRDYDYELCLPGIRYIVIYGVETDGYDENLVTLCLKEQGLEQI